MKVVILAGGFGTRLSEETDLRPKPMVEIGGKPILWHIMKIYSSYGYNEFVILLGYKSYFIKEYFVNYFLHNSDISVDLNLNSVTYLKSNAEPWKVTLLDTGLNTMTGSRIKQAENIIGDNPFMLTYGDGVSDISIPELVSFHKKHGKLLTITSAQPDGRFGALDIGSDNRILEFVEKPKGDGSFINAGFFVCEPGVFDYLKFGELSEIFEAGPLSNLASNGQAYAFKHNGFWMPMDTLRDKNILNEMCKNNSAPWIKW
uniref:glucose-1-phosphate cytidylyltransferase n=1 Tax=Flavobacterium sp. TaxID=239 RepID=UPI00404A2776